MVLLTNTNIIVDEFNYGKVRSSYNYIYFLSHMHSGTQNNFFLKNRPLSRTFEQMGFRADLLLDND